MHAGRKRGEALPVSLVLRDPSRHDDLSRNSTMDSLGQIPTWLGAALLSAIIAALGYVAKLLLEAIENLRTTKRTRRARLVELLSLLRAGQASYYAQSEIRDRLANAILRRNSDLAKSNQGYERLFAAAHPSMSADELELHAIVRTITINTLQPLNEAILKWIREDDYFKAARGGSGYQLDVAKKLGALYTHLLLWEAKYKVWMPETPVHALVYLDDEEKHGVGFPKGIENDVERLLNEGR